jgi:hypothetical protein
MTIACIWVSYILNVRDFHRKAYRPDVYREEFVQMVCPENATVLNDQVDYQICITSLKGYNH